MLRLSLIVFIGFSAGCWKHQRTASVPDVVEEDSTEIETSQALTNSETKVTHPFRKTDHCYDFTNDTKIYTGHVNRTVTGKPCLHWSDVDPLSTEPNNYCRDPHHQNEGAVWCYCTNCTNGREFCPVPWCGGASHRDCHRTSNGYLGQVNHTISGVPCQMWNVDYPHTVRKAPDGDRSQTNYCSEAGGLKRAWCYKAIKVDVDEQNWEYCNVTYDCEEKYYDDYYDYDDSYDYDDYHNDVV